MVSNEEEEDRLAGYETIKRLPPTKEAKVKCYIVMAENPLGNVGPIVGLLCLDVKCIQCHSL